MSSFILCLLSAGQKNKVGSHPMNTEPDWTFYNCKGRCAFSWDCVIPANIPPPYCIPFKGFITGHEETFYVMGICCKLTATSKGSVILSLSLLPKLMSAMCYFTWRHFMTCFHSSEHNSH